METTIAEAVDPLTSEIHDLKSRVQVLEKPRDQRGGSQVADLKKKMYDIEKMLAGMGPPAAALKLESKDFGKGKSGGKAERRAEQRTTSVYLDLRHQGVCEGRTWRRVESARGRSLIPAMITPPRGWHTSRPPMTCGST